MFEGTCVPRSGVIYPTLQRLDSGNVVGSRLEDKPVYTTTKSGKKYVKRHEASLEETIRYTQRTRADPEFSILKRASRLQKTIVAKTHEMSKETMKWVAKTLDDANAKLSKT
jgi:DNA-binding PadR family transcriptional regulator